MKKLILTSISVFFYLFIFTGSAKAEENSINCPNRFVTLVNPVRSRELWADKSLKPLQDQYQEIKKYNFPATWLLQYDVLNDNELVSEIKSFDTNQEKGIFLEISSQMTDASGIPHDLYKRWSDPSLIFLSAYTRTQRKVLIDEVFNQFKADFGYFPKSVGAWWIDSYSLNYLVDKYKVKSVLIVADQKITDSYGIFGQWWGYPYFSSKNNILIPASSKENKLPAVVIQWAQRDPVLAYGGIGQYSLYSLQANDYTTVGKNINYFSSLLDTYLDCKNQLGQATVGLETGNESVHSFPEYTKQLAALNNIKNLNLVTMSNFADNFKQIYLVNPPKVILGVDDKNWELTPNYRKNVYLNDYITYNSSIPFSDYFVADKSSFLKRYVSDLSNIKPRTWFNLYLLGLCLTALAALILKKKRVFLSSTLFSFAAFWPIFRFHTELGWKIFYGFQAKDMSILQLALPLASFLVVWLIYEFLTRKRKFGNPFLLLLPLTFGIDYLVELFRFSYINNVYYFGLFLDRTRFLGLTFTKNMKISLLFLKNFSPVLSESFLKLDLDRIFGQNLETTILKAVIHISLALILIGVFKRLILKKQWVVIAVVFAIAFFAYILRALNADPIAVLPIY